MTTLTPPMSALLAGLFLGETLGLLTWIGMTVTLLGISWVVRERTPAAESPGIYPGTLSAGVFHATVGTLGQAFGAVCSKKAMMLGTEPLDATLARMLLAVLFSLVIAGCRRQIGSWFEGMRAPGLLRRVVPASFLGTYIGVWLCLLSYDLTEVGIATTMQSTSPIFVIPLVMIFLRQKVSTRSLLGAAVAVGGVVLMFR